MDDFRIIVKTDQTSKTRIFRLKFGEKIIALGNLNVLATIEDEAMATFMTELLNIAFNEIMKGVDHGSI